MQDLNVDGGQLFLTSVVTRLSIDQLRRIRACRQAYAGPWLPKPIVTAALGTQGAATRQLVHRAHLDVDAGHVRFKADRRTHAAAVERFLTGCQDADVDALMGVLAPDVVIACDGGGPARAPRFPGARPRQPSAAPDRLATNVPPGTGFALEFLDGSLRVVARRAICRSTPWR